jgi:hypothetical protein
MFVYHLLADAAESSGYSLAVPLNDSPMEERRDFFISQPF